MFCSVHRASMHILQAEEVTHWSRVLIFIVSDRSLKTRTGTEPFSQRCSSCHLDFLWKVRLCREKYYTWLKCLSSYLLCFSPTVVERGYVFLAVWLSFL